MLIKDKFHTRTSHSLITPSVSDSFVAVLPNLSNAACLWEFRGAGKKSPRLPPPSQPIHHPQSELGRDISLIGDGMRVPGCRGDEVFGERKTRDCNLNHITGPALACLGAGREQAMHAVSA